MIYKAQIFFFVVVKTLKNCGTSTSILIKTSIVSAFLTKLIEINCAILERMSNLVNLSPD